MRLVNHEKFNLDKPYEPPPSPPYMPEFADAYPLGQAGELLNNLNSEKIKADFAHNLRN